MATTRQQTSARQAEHARQVYRQGLPKWCLATLGVAVLLNSGCGLSQWAHNCFKVGPNYSRPPAPVASAWIDYRDPRVKSQEQDMSEWWGTFNDPILNSLIESAY